MALEHRHGIGMETWLFLHGGDDVVIARCRGVRYEYIWARRDEERWASKSHHQHILYILYFNYIL
jgi:hypothetical protein